LDEPPVGEAVWGKDGLTAMTSNGVDESIVWDTQTWHPRSRLTGNLGGNISTFTLSQDGQQAVVVRDQRVSLVATRDGKVLASFEVPEAPGMASAIRFRPDGKGFAILWRDGRVDLFDPAQLQAEMDKLDLAR
jgi:hypothetical protein